MVALILRETKGSELTFAELDGNFTFLQAQLNDITQQITLTCPPVSLVVGLSYTWTQQITVPRFLASLSQSSDLASGALIDVKIYSGTVLKYWGQYTSILTADESQAWIFRDEVGNGQVTITATNIGTVDTLIGLVISGEAF